MRIDGAEAFETPLYWMVIGNTRSYGGFRQITYRAEVDDGKLDVAYMRRGGVFHLLADGARLLLGRHDRSPNIEYIRAESIEIMTPALPTQLDGDPHDETPMRFSISPRALTAIVPAGLKSPLFTAAAPA